MKNINLSTHGVYILSGVPGSGKSTWIKNAINLPPSAIISSDSIREELFGVRYTLDGSSAQKHHLFEGRNQAVFDIMTTKLKHRTSEKMLSVVDSTNVTDGERAAWAKIAKDAGMPVTVLIFDQDEQSLIERDQKRARTVGQSVIKKFYKDFQKTSHLPYHIVNDSDNCVATFNPPTLPHDKIDVVGDVHGLYDDLLLITSRLGYSIDENYVFQHPENRKILIVGDWLDRGQKSMECLRAVHNSCTKGGHFAIMGNHEQKVWRTYHTWEKEGKYSPVAFGSAETLVSLWKKTDKKTLAQWMSWMNSLPPAYTFDRLVFCHADIRSIDLFNMPSSTLYYGESAFGLVDSDAEFSKWSESLGENGPILIRGHIPPTTENPTRVFSMERHVGFNGIIMAMPIDKFLNDTRNGLAPSQSVAKNQISHQTDFDFTAHQSVVLKNSKDLQSLVNQNLLTSEREKSFGFTIYHTPINGNKKMNKKDFNEIQNLEKNKLISHKTNEDGLGIYKYTKRVFFDSLWGESPMLMHARGLVLDPAGNIIQNPFVKVFNYGERNAGADLKESDRVEVVEKMNGFLGCVTKHPFLDEELLVTTTGSFDSDFVGFIKDFITPKVKQRFLEYLAKQDKTLMFEVVHEKDPHIIAYKPHEMGLYLIGERSKELDSPLSSERELDVLAKELKIKRPKHYKTTISSLRKRIDVVEHEGYMVRDLNTGEPLIKWKSLHYLTVKFLGRMGPGQMKLMFEKPEVFKQKIDEEYYPLVDQLTKKTTFELFSQMKPDVRVPFVREQVHAMWQEMKDSAPSQNSIITNKPKKVYP